MARADLIIDLLKYSIAGNKAMVKKVAEAIIAEERSKQHTILADKLQYELNNAPKDSVPTTTTLMSQRSVNDIAAENFIQEIIPQRRLSDLILPDEVVYNCNQIIQEQFRA